MQQRVAPKLEPSHRLGFPPGPLVKRPTDWLLRSSRSSYLRNHPQSLNLKPWSAEIGIRRAPQSATLESPSTASPTSAEKSEHQNHGSLDWHKQWYPIASVKDLDSSKPTSVMLLGKKLVIWQDAQKQWRCFEDVCPHRKVPLSEGRIEESDGTLMCGYHGWRFEGSGRPTYIPQISATDKKAEQNALNSSRACAKVRPAQVRQGLLFVWGSSDPDALKDSESVPPPLSSLMEKLGDDFVYNYETWTRLLRGGMEIWVENSMDQSHTSFAHHKIGGQARGGDKEGYFEFLGSTYDASSFAFDYRFSLNGRALVDARTVFKPPCLLELSIKQNKDSGLWIYCTPVSKDCTLVIISSGGKRPQQQGWREKLLGRVSFFQALKRAKSHLRLHSVSDGDSVFMHAQYSNVDSAGDRIKRWSNAYMLPGDNDRGVSLWMKWLVNEAGGGPSYVPEAAQESMWDEAGRLKRHELLDRFRQHTAQCSSCTQVLDATKKAQVALVATLGALLLAAAGLLGSVTPLLSAPLAAVIAMVCLAGWAYRKLDAFKQEFLFKDWHQADLPAADP